MKEKNWITIFNKKYPTELDKYLDFSDEVKKRVAKKYKIKLNNDSERWATSYKMFFYLHDTYTRKTYKIDMDTGDINIVKE